MKAGASLSEHNKIMLFREPVTQQVTAIPCYWADTQEDNWFMTQCEIYARQIDTAQGLQDFKEKKEIALATLLLGAGIPDFYSHFEFDNSLESSFTCAKDWPIQTLNVVKEKGYWGGQWKAEKFKGVPVFKDWDVLIELCGSLMAASRM